MTIDERTLEQIARLISKAEAAIATYRHVTGTIGYPNLDSLASAEWRTQTMAFLTRTLGENDDYSREFREKTERYNYKNTVETGIGILRALQDDIEQGYLQTYRQQLSAEFVGDLIEQAEHLHENGFHQAAASIAGAALESGLREIAGSNGITIKGREDLNSLSDKLVGGKVFNNLERDQLKGPIRVRNAADHAEFDWVTATDVGNMIRDVRDLLAKHST